MAAPAPDRSLSDLLFDERKARIAHYGVFREEVEELTCALAQDTSHPTS